MKPLLSSIRVEPGKRECAEMKPRCYSWPHFGASIVTYSCYSLSHATMGINKLLNNTRIG